MNICMSTVLRSIGGTIGYTMVQLGIYNSILRFGFGRNFVQFLRHMDKSVEYFVNLCATHDRRVLMSEM